MHASLRFWAAVTCTRRACLCAAQGDLDPGVARNSCLFPFQAIEEFTFIGWQKLTSTRITTSLKSWVRAATLAVATHSDHGCLDKDHWSLLYVRDAISHCSCAWDMVPVVLGRKGDHTDPSDQRYLASTVQTRLPTSSVSGRNIVMPTDPVDRKIAIWCARARCVLSDRLGNVSVTPVLVSKLFICRQGVLLADLSIP